MSRIDMEREIYAPVALLARSLALLVKAQGFGMTPRKGIQL
jgi:hypothetical protein